LHPRRLRERGYDQASLLAQELAKFGKPLRLRGLSRIMHTSPQVGKNRPQRAANVKGAFVAVPSWVKDQRILLVDDVLTTGATAAEATNALCQAGARAVQVLAIARAF
jgi:ComF family protein